MGIRRLGEKGVVGVKRDDKARIPETQRTVETAIFYPSSLR